MFLRFSRSHHESRVRHIRINLLDNQVFRSLALILVGTLAQHLILPRLFALQVFCIPLPDIFHNEIDGPVHAALTRSSARKQQRHQSRLVLHVVNIPEPRLPEMRSQRREDSVRHSRLIKFRRSRYQQLHQLRQFLRHLRRVRIILLPGTLNFEIRTLNSIISHSIRIIHSSFFTLHFIRLLLCQRIHPHHFLRHRLRIVSIFRIEVVNQLMAVVLLIVARHFHLHHLHQFLFLHHPRSTGAHDSEQRRVSRPHGINLHTSESGSLRKEVECNQVLLPGSQSASILIASRIPDMRSISTMAITRLGRLNSRASRNSRIAVVAR